MSLKDDRVATFYRNFPEPYIGRSMQSIRDDIEVLRNKASECEHAAQFAIDNDCRAVNRKRAKLYRELVDEAELAIRRSTLAEWRGN